MYGSVVYLLSRIYFMDLKLLRYWTHYDPLIRSLFMREDMTEFTLPQFIFQCIYIYYQIHSTSTLQLIYITNGTHTPQTGLIHPKNTNFA